MDLPVRTDLANEVDALRRRVKELEAVVNKYNQAAEAEQYCITLLDSIDGIVWEFDLTTWRFTFVSPNVEQLLGYPVQRWLYADNFWFCYVHPDDQDRGIRYVVRCIQNQQVGGQSEFSCDSAPTVLTLSFR